MTTRRQEKMTDIIMLPTAAIEQAKNCYKLSRELITSRTKPAGLQAAKLLINDKLARFKLLADSAIEAAHKDHKTTAEQYKNIAAKDIVLTALSDDFTLQYADEIRDTNDSKTLLALLDDIIGTPTEKQAQSEAEENLANLTRDIDSEEKFERFYKRLDRLAGKATTDATIKNHLITKAFNRNITPRIRSFLHEQNKNNLDAQATAKYLDQMLKHKKTAYINNIENPEASARMIELQKQNTDLHDKMDSMQRLLATLLENQTQQNLDLQVNQIKPHRPQPAKPSPKPNKFQPPTHQGPPMREQAPQRYINPAWELNKYGKPFTCRKCGIRGHRDENCRGTHLACRICEKVGHIQYACPQRQTKNMSLN